MTRYRRKKRDNYLDRHHARQYQLTSWCSGVLNCSFGLTPAVARRHRIGRGWQRSCERGAVRRKAVGSACGG